MTSNLNVNPYTNEGFFDTLKPQSTNTLTIGNESHIILIPGLKTEKIFIQRGNTATQQIVGSGIVTFPNSLREIGTNPLTYNNGTFTNNTSKSISCVTSATWGWGSNSSSKTYSIQHSALGTLATTNSLNVAFTQDTICTTLLLLPQESFSFQTSCSGTLQLEGNRTMTLSII